VSDGHNEWRGDGFEGVEAKLRRNQSVPSADRLDEIKRTVLARDGSRGRSVGGFRRSLASFALVAGLVLGGGGAVVLAQKGGNEGGGSGSGNAADAQYGHGHRPCPRGQHPGKDGHCVPNNGPPCSRGRHPEKHGQHPGHCNPNHRPPGQQHGGRRGATGAGSSGQFANLPTCSDRRTGTSGNDVMRGGPANDCMDGRAGDDKLSGKRGDDTLTGGRGRDRMSGSRGDDVIYSDDGERDMVDCGRGFDRVKADESDRLRHCEVVDR